MADKNTQRQVVYDSTYDGCAREMLSDKDTPQSVLDYIAARGARVEHTRRGGDPSRLEPTPATESDLVAGLPQFAHGKDGCDAVARRLTALARSEDVGACKYADHKSVNGGLVRNRTGVSGRDLGRTQATTRAAVSSADVQAERCKIYHYLVTKCTPGGSIWRLCKSRTDKKYMRARVDYARRCARGGDYKLSCELLHGLWDDVLQDRMDNHK